VSAAARAELMLPMVNAGGWKVLTVSPLVTSTTNDQRRIFWRASLLLGARLFFFLLGFLALDTGTRFS
jgi:hypothetical protein